MHTKAIQLHFTLTIFSILLIFDVLILKFLTFNM
jgi:hypothetical protein